MWLWRFSALSLAAAFQVVLLVDALDTLADGGAVHWAAALSPSIVLLALFFLFVLFGCAGALCACAGDRSRERRAAGQQYQSLADLPTDADELGDGDTSSLACVYASDALIDLVLLIPAATFLGLLIAQLDSGGTLYSWAGVFAPLWILLVLLLVVFGASALRTRSERASRDELSERPRAAAATAEYQAIPCAYMCVPMMAYGTLDMIVAWLLFLLPLALAITLILLAVRLTDGALPALGAVFAPLWTVLGPLALVSLALYISLVVNYKGALKLPIGRVNIVAKHGEVIGVFVFSVLTSVQLILLTQRIEHADDERDWFVILLPTIIASVLGIFCSCCAIKGCTLEARIERQRARSAQTGTSIAYTTAGGKRPRSSHYGLLAGTANR